MTASAAITATAQDLALSVLTEVALLEVSPPGVSPIRAALPRPQRILLADDDVTSLTALAAQMSSPQRELHSVLCADVALELAFQLHFDLVVLHLTSPDADALEVIRSIRACRALQQPTIVIITESDKEATAAAALNGGADRVLHRLCDLVHPAALIAPLIADFDDLLS